jgi:hypothetical protein
MYVNHADCRLFPIVAVPENGNGKPEFAWIVQIAHARAVLSRELAAIALNRVSSDDVAATLVAIGHAERFPAPTLEPAIGAGQVADLSGLKFLGFIFAGVTVAVMSMTVLVVKGHADGTYVIENSVASMSR